MNQDLRNALPSGYRLEEYEIESVLGHGGFGVTYLARDTRLDTLVAIKEYMPGDLAVREGGATVHPRSGADRDEFLWGLERFLSEARTLARFKHPNIVTVLRFFEGNGTAYLVMEYEEGDSLDEVLRRKKTLKETELWPILIPLLDGLAQVHETGFLHRDIKPGNIFIRADGSPVLIDFGAARQAIGQKSKSLTAIVTAGYAPVEQYGTGGEQGAWTDIYALAGVLYRAVTGGPLPASPDRATAILRGDADPMVPAVTAGKGRCSAKVLAAIDKGLGVLEKDRPQSVGDWQTMLFGGRERPVVAGAPVRQGRSAAAGAIAGIVVTLLLLGGGYAAWQMMQDGGVDGNRPQTQQAQISDAGTAGGASGDGQISSGDAAISASAIQRAEAEAKRRADEQARQRAAAEEKRKAEAKRNADEAARKKAAASSKRKAEEQARANAAAEAEQKAKAAASRKAAADAKRQAEDAARKKAEAEQQAQEAARRAAAAEAERKAAAKARAKAEAEASRKAEEETRKQATAEARRKAEAKVAAKRKAEEEAGRRAAAAKAKAEVEAKRQAALEARFAELERRAKEAEERAKAAERAAKSSAGSPTQTARIPDPSTPDGLKALFAGATVTASRVSQWGLDLLYRVSFAGAGTMRGNSVNQGDHTEESDSGKWTVEAGKLCVRWTQWDDGAKRCYTIAGKKNPYAASGPPGIFRGELFINR